MINIYNSEILYANEYNLANQLQKEGFMPDPEKCKCENKYFTIQKDNSQKTSRITWRCSNYKCRNKFNIRINSFFNYFPIITISTLYEVIKCFICLNFNKKKAYEYLNNEKK